MQWGHIEMQLIFPLNYQIILIHLWRPVLHQPEIVQAKTNNIILLKPALSQQEENVQLKEKVRTKTGDCYSNCSVNRTSYLLMTKVKNH